MPMNANELPNKVWRDGFHFSDVKSFFVDNYTAVLHKI